MIVTCYSIRIYYPTPQLAINAWYHSIAIYYWGLSMPYCGRSFIRSLRKPNSSIF